MTEDKQPDKEDKKINTGGGSYIAGTVTTGGGDFVGRDKATTFDQRGQNVGTQYNVAGNIINAEQIIFPKALSAKIPQPALDKIVGRDNDLTDLHQRLYQQRQVVLVNGMGGIGKTTLAQVYVAQYWDEYYYVAWISQTSDNVLNDFVNTEGLLDRLHIPGGGQEAKDLFVQIMTALQTMPNQPNLLVIDNAESILSDLYEYLPQPPMWHILVTSRQHIEKFDMKELDFLSEEAAIALFLRHYTLGKLPQEEIKGLVNIVDLHTLTIEILAKTAQTQRTKINHLKQAIADDLRTNVYVAHKGQKIDRVTSYLCSIFTLARLSDNELWLLKQFTCLPSEFHPYERLDALIYPEASQKTAIFAETLEALTATGWLLKNQAADSYKMHRIIGDVIKKQYAIAITDAEPLVEGVIVQLKIDQNKDNPTDKFLWVPFGQAILAIFPTSNLASIAALQNNLATVLKDMGDYVGAKTLLEQAVRSNEKNFGSDHSTTLASYSNLATVLQELGDYVGAKTLLEQVVCSIEKNFEPDHPIMAVSYSNLALVLEVLGDYTRAKMLLEQAVRLDEKNFGPDHSNTAVRYLNLALVLQAMGDYSRAKTLLEQAVCSIEKNFGPDHPTTVASYSNLATMLQDMGDYTRAKTLFEQAVCSDEKNFGPDHPMMARRYSNLGLVLSDLGDYARAKTLLEQAMRLDEKNFGPDHPDTAVSYSNLATVLQELDDYAGAKTLLEQAMRSDEKNFGPDHPTTARRYSNLGLVLQDLGDHAGAKTLLEQAMCLAEKNFEPDHPNIAVSYSNLGLVLEALGDYAEALALSGKALHIFQKVLPHDHLYIKQTSDIYQSIKRQMET